MHRDYCHWEKVEENFPPISIRLKIFYLFVFVLGSRGGVCFGLGFFSFLFCFFFCLFVWVVEELGLSFSVHLSTGVGDKNWTGGSRQEPQLHHKSWQHFPYSDAVSVIQLLVLAAEWHRQDHTGLLRFKLT